MKILRAYKTRLTPNKDASTTCLCGTPGRLVLFITGHWLIAIKRYKAGNPTTLFEQKKRFNALKREQFPWITEIPYAIQENLSETWT